MEGVRGKRAEKEEAEKGRREMAKSFLENINIIVQVLNNKTKKRDKKPLRDVQRINHDRD